MLMPVAVLVVVILGALAVDQVVVFGAQRDLVATAQAAANDAAAYGLDPVALRRDGSVVVDPARLDRAVQRAAALADGPVEVTWSVDGEVITVRLHGRVDLVFSPGVPGGADTAAVTATASARLDRR